MHACTNLPVAAELATRTAQAGYSLKAVTQILPSDTFSKIPRVSNQAFHHIKQANLSFKRQRHWSLQSEM